MFKRLIKEAAKLFSRKELVGTDKSGNRYYRWQEKEPTYTGKWIEKREVDLVKRDYDPQSLPPEWLAWLHRFRQHPPTAEECQQLEIVAAKRAARVAALDAEEQKRKFKMESLQAQGIKADAQPNMKRFVDQLTSLGYGQQPSKKKTEQTNTKKQPSSPKNNQKQTKKGKKKH